MGRLIDPRALGLAVSKMAGLEAHCICPFHNDKSPSASFNVLNGKFICFACHTTSTAAKIAEMLDGEFMIDSAVGQGARTTLILPSAEIVK